MENVVTGTQDKKIMDWFEKLQKKRKENKEKTEGICE